MAQTKKTPRSLGAVGALATAGTKNIAKSQKAIVRSVPANNAPATPGVTSSTPAPAGSQVNAVLVAPKPEIQQQQQGQTLRLHQKELLIKMSGLEKTWAVPLAPGWTGAARLDEMAREHAWARWDADVKITFRSLAPGLTPGTYSYLVVHDATLDQISDPKYWDTSSRQYTTNLATVSFTHTIPVSVVKRQISMTTTSYSWFLIKYDGQGVAPGELWLEYEVTFGGIGEANSQPRHFTVSAGSFQRPNQSGPCEGFPVYGKHNHYTFSDPPPTRKQVEDLLEQMQAKPHQIERVEGDKPTVTDDTKVRGVGFSLPDGWTNIAKTALGKLGSVSGLRILKPLKFVLDLATQKSVDRGLFRDEQPTGFAGWSGTVTLHTARDVAALFVDQPTLPPIPSFSIKEGTEQEASAELKAYAMTSGRATARVGAVGAMLGTALAEYVLDPSGPVATAFVNLLRKWFERPTVIHRGQHALHFFKVGKVATSQGALQEGVTDKGENPNLPEVPSFNDDLLAPGAEQSWGDSTATLNGYVVDDNGTPRVHYLTVKSGKTTLISAPSPVYYRNLKRPWDSEEKRLLALKVNVSSALAKHYLLVECYNWGDDACGGWLNPSGGTYLGTVCRFGAISASRSAIRIDDVNAWNGSTEHLGVGQSKLKYRSSDKGRTSMFILRYGVVGRYDVATNFLANWLVDPSVTRLINHPYKKGVGALQSEAIKTVSDFNYTRAALVSDPNLDPTAPGFPDNYAAHNQVNRAEVLPQPIEAGPFRVLISARYDNANGWWQDVPKCAWTDTDVGSRWTFQMRLDGTTNTQSSASRNKCCVARVTTPPYLTQGAYLCIESVGLGGTEHNVADAWEWVKASEGTTPNGDFWASCTHLGALVISRRVIQFGDAQDSLQLWTVGDTSLPTDSIESCSGDIYVSNVTVAYLVRDANQAKNWVNDNTTRDQNFNQNSEYWWNANMVSEVTPGDVWGVGDKVSFTTAERFTASANITSLAAWNSDGKVVQPLQQKILDYSPEAATTAKSQQSSDANSEDPQVSINGSGLTSPDVGGN